MKKILHTVMMTIFPLSLSIAEDNRRIDMTHTATYYANGGICTYAFDLQSLDPFSNLKLTINILDLFGNIINTKEMDVSSFGNSSADRYTSSLIEMECSDKSIREFSVVKAVEFINNKELPLPMNIFHANNPDLAKVSIQTSTNKQKIHENLQGIWVSDKKLCTDLEVQTDADYIAKVYGDTINIEGWMYSLTETFDFNNIENHNNDNGFGGWANFSGSYPDYSQDSGIRESEYILENGYLNVGENAQLISCKK